MSTSRAKYSFLDERWKDYICVKCECILHKAVQTSTCGHRFCEACINDLLHSEVTLKIKTVARCPKRDCAMKLKCSDSDGIEYFPDRCARRELNELMVRCLVANCQWTGQYQQFEEHRKAQHCVYAVKPSERGKASKALVDLKQLETATSAHRHFQKLSKEVQRDKKKLKEKKKELKVLEEKLSSSIEQLGENFDPVRVQVTERVEDVAKSTSSLGRAGQQETNERSSTLDADKPEEMVHLETKPTSDYPRAIAQTNTSSKAALVTGACALTGVHYSKEETHPSHSAKEYVVLKPKKSNGTQRRFDRHSPPSSSSAQMTDVMTPRVSSANGATKHTPSPSPPSSPTSASAGAPYPSRHRYRFRGSPPVETSSQPSHSSSHSQLQGAHPSAYLNGNDEAKRGRECQTCKIVREKLRSARFQEGDCKCYENFVLELQKCIDT